MNYSPKAINADAPSCQFEKACMVRRENLSHSALKHALEFFLNVFTKLAVQ